MLQMLGQEMRKGRLSLDEAAVATAYLDAVLAGVVMDMDATISASHGGSGAGWFSLATVPADGAAAGDYELTAYGFSFSGAPGDPGSYWLSDGDSYFQLAGANPAFLDEMHKSTGGHDWWIAMAFRLPDAGGTHALWSTQSGTTATGHRLAVNSAKQPNYIQRGDTANSQTGNLAAFAPDTDTLAIFSRSHGAGQTRYWINTTTAATVSHS